MPVVSIRLHYWDCDANELEHRVMFLTDNYSIKEVLAFPFLKEDVTMRKDKLAAEEVGIKPEAEEGIGKSSYSRSTAASTNFGF